MKINAGQLVALGRASLTTCVVSCALLLAGPAYAFTVEDGQQATSVLGWPDFVSGWEDNGLYGAAPTAADRFFVPADVEFDTANERLFVADFHNHRVLVFDTSGGVTSNMSAAFVLGQPNFVTGGADPLAPFEAMNSTNVSEGCVTDINACGISRPYAIAYDSARQWLFTSDHDNHRVLVWDLSGSIGQGMRAFAVIGQADLQHNDVNASCDGATWGEPNSCGLDSPKDIAYDQEQQRLYVADSGNHRVLVFDVSAAPSNGTQAIAVLGQGSLDENLDGNGCGAEGENSIDACSMNVPLSLTLETGTTPRLFVSDFETHRVLIFELGGGISNGMPASTVLGQLSFSSADVNVSCTGETSALSACGFGAYDIYLDFNEKDNLLYVSDSDNNRVLVFDAANMNNGDRAKNVLGRPDFRSRTDADSSPLGGGTDRIRLVAPFGVSYDSDSDRVFVSDGGNHRILVYGANVGGAAVEVKGEPQFVTSTVDPISGETTLDITNVNNDIFSVTFPPGTTPEAGEDSIVVTVGRFGWFSRANIQIQAELPPNTTKAITMSRNGRGMVCIHDHADSTVFRPGSGNCVFHGVAHYRWLPPRNTCWNINIDGDPGDNGHPEGLHPIELCRDVTNTLIIMRGLLHTSVSVGDFNIAPDADRDLWGERDLQEPRTGSCTAANGGHSGVSNGIVLLLCLMLVGRTRSQDRNTVLRRKR